MRPALLHSEAGMTMIELLTSIVILAVLTAIALPAFFLHRDRARDASAQASARSAQTAALVIGQQNDGEYDGPGGVTVRNLVTTEPTLRGETLTVPRAGDDTFTIRVQSDTGNTFAITQNNDGTVDLTCASADDAGCPSDGTWE